HVVALSHNRRASPGTSTRGWPELQPTAYRVLTTTHSRLPTRHTKRFRRGPASQMSRPMNMADSASTSNGARRTPRSVACSRRYAPARECDQPDQAAAEGETPFQRSPSARLWYVERPSGELAVPSRSRRPARLSQANAFAGHGYSNRADTKIVDPSATQVR